MITSEYSYPKDLRILKKLDFNYLRTKAKVAKQPLLIAFYKKSRINSSNTRFALSISKKVGKAIVRNRIKRILRELFRKSNFKNLGQDVLIVVNPKTFKDRAHRKEDESQLLSDLRSAFEQIQKNQ